MSKNIWFNWIRKNDDGWYKVDNGEMIYIDKDSHTIHDISMKNHFGKDWVDIDEYLTEVPDRFYQKVDFHKETKNMTKIDIRGEDEEFWAWLNGLEENE